VELRAFESPVQNYDHRNSLHAFSGVDTQSNRPDTAEPSFSDLHSHLRPAEPVLNAIPF